MNHLRKEAAINKYKAAFTGGATREELYNLLGQDEKTYSVEEINEIVDAIIGEQGNGVANPPPFATPHYEEWHVQVKNGKYEKLKLLRAKVIISEREAEILNDGVLNGSNNYASMYFSPE